MNTIAENSGTFGEDWPLDKKEISILDTNHECLVDLLELTDLLDRLYSSKVINRRQKESISSKPTSHEKNDVLLGILRRRSLRYYRQTINCLRESQQSHIAKVLKEGGEKKITSSKATAIIKDQTLQYRVFLEEFMDPDFGLLDKIRANGTIGWREIEDVTCQRPSWKRNSQLLCHILDKDQSDCLIAALEDADQIHIANYLIANGENSGTFGEDWPLKKKEIAILDTNHECFVDLLELTDLLDRLYSSKVINRRQMDSISSKPTSHEKNDVLLGILRRRSVRDYRQTINCLLESQQSHIAKVLKEGGGVVRVHTNLNGDDENSTEIENKLVTTITNILTEKSIGKTVRLPKINQAELIAAKVGQSVVLYLYCKTIEELQQLRESLISGQLKHSVELWFNSLFTRSQKIAVTALKASSEEFQKMQTYFRETDHQTSETTETIFSETTLYDLPLEMMDIILQKSYLHWILNSSAKQRDEEVIRSLTSVDVCFNRRITRQRFKKAVWRYLKHFYEKTKKRSAIIINNKNFLLENIKPNDKFIDSLLSLNCTTEEQSHFIERSNQEKNTELLYLLRSFDETKFSNFVRYLLQTNQKTEARLMENVGRFLSKYYPKAHVPTSDKLIDSLLSLNCLTEAQSRLIQGQRLKQQQRRIRDKNTELLHFLRSFDDARSSNFVRNLRQTNQKTVARIMENGGVVIKVEVHNQGTKITSSIEANQLHKKIEDLQNRTKPWSHQTDEIISQMKEKGIEILNSQLDRQTAVFWIWCRSHAALEHIEELYGSNKLRDVLIGIANIRSSSSEITESIAIKIDSCQFKKTVVAYPISINFTKKIVKEDEDVYGVTKLRNEIYVLCQSDSHPNLIYVFEDRSPFNLQKKIEINEIQFSVDIGSSEKENCLYVSDYDEKCVWKITKETEDQHKIIKWLTTDYEPDTLSVSSDGRLLVVSMYRSILSIYGLDAELIRSINLPRYIKNPRHAVETSIGNFIIIHQWMEDKHILSGSNGREERTNWVVSELTRDGQVVIRGFIFSNEAKELVDPKHLSLYLDDQVFVVDKGNHGVVLFDSDLKWNRNICPTKEVKETSIQWPRRLFYDETKKQLIVGGEGVTVYTLSQK